MRALERRLRIQTRDLVGIEIVENFRLVVACVGQLSADPSTSKSKGKESSEHGSSDDVSGDVTVIAGLASGGHWSWDDLKNWGRHIVAIEWWKKNLMQGKKPIPLFFIPGGMPYGNFPIPEKVKILIWRIYHDVLPT
ncbi:hypothetical protein Sjap_025121 [Stephania japonica]|uniref:Uncharacterized protein n=1 Tax=Stephania japonica TaxID=461633 RepID=A0AAP0E3U2_9MAGN